MKSRSGLLIESLLYCSRVAGWLITSGNVATCTGSKVRLPGSGEANLVDDAAAGGSGQRPSSHMYLYQKTLCRLRVAILKWQQKRKVATGLGLRKDKGGKTVSCVTRRVLPGANESRNLILTSAGKPMASHGWYRGRKCSPPGNFVATELFIDKRQVMEDSIQSRIELRCNCS